MKFKTIMELIVISACIISMLVQFIMYKKRANIRSRKIVYAIEGEVLFICSIAITILYIYLEIHSDLIIIWIVSAVVNKIESILGIIGYIKFAACDELCKTIDDFWIKPNSGENVNNYMGRFLSGLFTEFVFRMGFDPELINQDEKEEKQDNDE